MRNALLVPALVIPMMFSFSVFAGDAYKPSAPTIKTCEGSVLSISDLEGMKAPMGVKKYLMILPRNKLKMVVLQECDSENRVIFHTEEKDQAALNEILQQLNAPQETAEFIKCGELDLSSIIYQTAPSLLTVDYGKDRQEVKDLFNFKQKEFVIIKIIKDTNHTLRAFLYVGMVGVVALVCCLYWKWKR